MDNELIVICDQIFKNVISQITIHLRFMDIALDHYIFVPNFSRTCDLITTGTSSMFFIPFSISDT